MPRVSRRTHVVVGNVDARLVKHAREHGRDGGACLGRLCGPDGLVELKEVVTRRLERADAKCAFGKGLGAWDELDGRVGDGAGDGEG